MDNDAILTVDEFVRSINVNKGSPHALFLGAGASLSSGVPSAKKCVDEWKREIFVTNNPTMKDLVAEQSIVSVQRRIDAWLKANGHWPPPNEDDYSFFIERCHPIADDRRRFFEPWIRKARPHTGYKLLCLLAQSQIIQSVWTTNFDTLVARAAAATSVVPVEIGIDCQHRTFRQPSASELTCVSMHGDYRYDELTNTVEELQEQEAKLVESLCESLQSQSLIVIGYSGRDASIMAALSKAICCEGPTKVYWCDHRDEPDPAVDRFIAEAREHDRQVFYVPNSDFDDLMIRLATISVTDAELSGEVAAIVGSRDTSDMPLREPFGMVRTAPTGMIKSNAWPLRCPAEAFAFELKKWPEERVWKWIEDQVQSCSVVAVPFRDKVLALGTMDDIQGAFGEHIDGTIDRVPICENELAYEDGAVISLLKRALVPAIAARLWHDTDNRYKVWTKASHTVERQAGKPYSLHRCMELDLRFSNGRVYLTVDPTCHIPTDSDDDKSNVDEIKRRVLGYQHNREYNVELEFWRGELTKDEETTSFDYPPNSGAFRFWLTNTPAFASVSRPGHRQFEIPANYQSLIYHQGVVCDDPDLLFGRAASWNPGSDKMPLRGLDTFGPFDKALNMPAVDQTIKTSIICPKAEAATLEPFLNGIHRSWPSLRPEKEDYLVPYKGFEQEFHVPIQIPKRSDRMWHTLPELTQTEDIGSASRELARNINDAINSAATLERTIIIILTPQRWAKYREYETDNESFNVHDYVKAYAAQRGIATQFLLQEKLDVQDKCRFWWWFAVAMYAKSMRTPWVLDQLDPNTAYVGLGYAIDRKAAKGRQTVLGCSHLYNSQGQGLEFRLSRIEDPIIRGRNAYLRFDDARRIGETIRALYWDYKRQLPERVVIHKLFPFRNEEKKGLMAGLSGVCHLDLLEINHESKLRYVSSRVRNGKLEVEGYPIRRGTSIRMSDFEALLWVHGSTDSLNERYTYFQGKRRIPGPIVVRRHSGVTQFKTIANEILGLSKMDWNSGDLYSQLPATVYSSKRVARIASLLERLGTESFDYRLFM